MQRFLAAVVVLMVCCTIGVSGYEQPSDPIVVFYFTGIGCPHCANVDPVIFGEWLEEYPDLVVVEYELYKHETNGRVFTAFVNQFGMGTGVPNLLMGYNGSVSGDKPILSTLPGVMAERENITAQYGEVLFRLETSPIATLPGEPQIWHGDRILIRNGTAIQDEMFLHQLLIAEDLTAVLSGTPYTEINATPVPISGSSILFDHAVAIDGWILQWNGEALAEPTTAAVVTQSPLPAWLALVAFGAVCLGYSRVKR
jgi:hypothetical protein